MNETQKYLKEFFSEMQKILEEHQNEKGDSWQEQSDETLLSNLFEEIREFTIKNDPQLELVDIANSCFILWAKRKYFKDL